MNCTRLMMSLGLILCCAPITAGGQPFADENLWLNTPVYRLGENGSAVGDTMPTVIYEAGAGARTWQMWWFGTRADEPDLGLPGVDADYHGQSDRIFYASSADGDVWTPTEIVLRGRVGSAPFDAGDDHMVGSPSVIRVDGTLYMFYEAYGNWIAPLNLFYNAVHGDTWLQPGVNIVGDPAGSRSDYLFARNLGFAPRYRKYGTVPIYAGLVTYENGEINHFVYSEQLRPTFAFTELNGGEPVFWLFDEAHRPEGGAKPIYTIWNGASWDTGVKDDPNDHPDLPLVELLGYAYSDLDTPETLGVMQNKIHLAKLAPGASTWQRVDGPATGRAIAAPRDQRTTSYAPVVGADLSNTDNHASWDLLQNYGAGYPSALIRDGYVELYYPDISVARNFQLRVSVSDIENATAWASAAASSTAVDIWLGGEIAWSDVHQSYFAAFLRQQGKPSPYTPFDVWTIDNNATFVQAPAITWASSIHSVDTYLTDGLVATSAPGDGTPELFGRIALWGTFARTPEGHTLDFPDGDGVNPANYTAFHHFYGSVDRALMTSQSAIDNHVHDTEIDHSLEFVYWPVDNDADGVLDHEDNCTAVANAGQQDADGDGHGNRCDLDYDNDCTVGFDDLNELKQAFFSEAGDDEYDPGLDWNSDGAIGFDELNVLKQTFFLPPGPSAAPALCTP